MRTLAARRGSGSSAVMAPSGQGVPADGARPPARPGLFVVVIRADGGGRRDGTGLHAEEVLHFRLDLEHERRVVAQEQLGVLAPLSDPLVAVGVPGTRLLDD